MIFDDIYDATRQRRKNPYKSMNFQATGRQLTAFFMPRAPPLVGLRPYHERVRDWDSGSAITPLSRANSESTPSLI